jgi:hypothetical protein
MDWEELREAECNVAVLSSPGTRLTPKIIGWVPFEIEDSGDNLGRS